MRAARAPRWLHASTIALGLAVYVALAAAAALLCAVAMKAIS